MAAKVGLLVGQERAFPEALRQEVSKRQSGVTVEYASIDITQLDAPLPYEVLVDRISHEVTCYQPLLKQAALFGTKVINNPFWRIADDKFFNNVLAKRLGVKVPKTALLPSKSYGEGVSKETLENLVYPLGWETLAKDLGFPLYLKPHWGGGWREIYRVKSLEELFSVYDQTGRLTMMAQEEIRWTQYVRCLVIGQTEVRPALWDPHHSHFDRYTKAKDSMPPLSPLLKQRVVSDASKLCQALGYDMNTVEFAICDGVPYAIDFMNSAPDFDISSLGEEHFRWVVEKMADLVIRFASKETTLRRPYRWDTLLKDQRS